MESLLLTIWSLFDILCSYSTECKMWQFCCFDDCIYGFVQMAMQDIHIRGLWGNWSFKQVNIRAEKGKIYFIVEFPFPVLWEMSNEWVSPHHSE